MSSCSPPRTIGITESLFFPSHSFCLFALSDIMNAKTCIETLCEKYPQFADTYTEFLNLYDKRYVEVTPCSPNSLWYQLTVALVDFTQKEENYVTDNMIIVGCAKPLIYPKWRVVICWLHRQLRSTVRRIGICHPRVQH